VFELDDQKSANGKIAVAVHTNRTFAWTQKMKTPNCNAPAESMLARCGKPGDTDTFATHAHLQHCAV
jgi:hypothetical protein